MGGVMLRNQRLRRRLAVLFYYPFLASVVTKSFVCDSWRLLFPAMDGDVESLAYWGMSGDFVGTVVTVFVKRDDVRASLPPALTVVDDDELPDWLRHRDDHPVIMLLGRQSNLGKRKPIFGTFRTVRLFRPYLETFVGIPFLKPRASDGPNPCLHFVRVPCSKFWPTETGALLMGWPKVQCPMEMREEGATWQYRIRDEGGRNPWLSVEADLADAEPVDPGQQCLAKMISMLSQPHVLIKGDELVSYQFDLRFEAAEMKAVSAAGSLHPGFLPSLTERIDFSSPKITDVEFGAFFLDAKFINRALEESSDSFWSMASAYLRA